MLQSEGLVLIAISYKYKGNIDKILQPLERARTTRNEYFQASSALSFPFQTAN